MQNQICTQPQAYIPQQMPIQTYPAPSVGAVNIQIFNPTAAPASGFYQPVPCGCYPCNYNNLIQAPAMQNLQMLPKYNAFQQPQIVPDMSQQTGIMPSNTEVNLNNNMNGVASQGDGDSGKKTEKKDNKPKVILTDDYIKTLENYLNSQDKKIRLMGAKDLLDRFKEDESRKDDPALTALLNKTIQDPAETVKFVGLTTLDSGYANGNNETAQILSQMQASNSSYGEDATLASKILLKMSGNQTIKQNQAGSQIPQNNTQNLLNKVPNPDGGVLMTNNALSSMPEDKGVNGANIQ